MSGTTKLQFSRGPVVLAILSVLVSLFTLGVVGSSVALAEQGPRWTITAVSRPTNFKPGDESGIDAYRIAVTNTGGAPSDGSPIEITDELPAGLSLDAVGTSGEDLLAPERDEQPSAGFSCATTTCTYSGIVVPDETLMIIFRVDVTALAPASVTNVVRVIGGGAPDSTMETPTAITDSPASFGISPGGATTSLSTSQAGAHADLTTSIAFNTVNAAGTLAEAPKETIDDMPPGFAADLVDTPTCPAAEFRQRECGLATQIGVATVSLVGVTGGVFTHSTNLDPVYDLAPDPGEVAKIGFVVEANAFVEGGIYLRGDYGARAVFENIRQSNLQVDSVTLTLWGVPADSIHDPLRFKGTEGVGKFGASSDAVRAPWFTNATSCDQQRFEATFTASSWEEPQHKIVAQMPFGPMIGCDRLTIEPTLSTQPTTPWVSSPTGLNVDIKIPQTYENPEGLATSHLDDARVILPAGMTINPSAGAGLGPCTETEFKHEGETVEPDPALGCPNDSKIGSVKIVSPVIKEQATGSVFVAQPFVNRFNSLLALYIIARIPDRGVVVAVAGKVSLDPITGQLTTMFDENPQLPFSDVAIGFRQGQTSPLVSPPSCGTFASEANLTPWSVPTQQHLLYSGFEITRGIGGGLCPSGGIPPLAPQVIAGTQTSVAGHYSPFYLRIIREDGEQEITKFTTILPPGLTGNLTGIPFCPDDAVEAARRATGQREAATPSCPAASEIGHSLVGAGISNVLAWTPGKVYLAGPYHGSTLSIVSITGATVGPFDLGTVVIRFALRINPMTAQVEIDSTGSDPIPHIIDGIVVHVRDIHVYIDRSRFMINPTSCEHLSIENTITGAGSDPANPANQQAVQVSTPFQAADCASLGFKPGFKVFTSAKTSRKEGASLHVTLSYPKAPQGTQTNIRSVHVELPKALPSRLSTLQHACLDSVFNQDPANCPSQSRVGFAKAMTYILPVPLEGPAYFVSHGGQRFPELILVLQGYGITIDLEGETYISKSGVTSSTFKSIPDAPVGRFELSLPSGPNSALAANQNLCYKSLKEHKRAVKQRVKLVIPTVFTAQNGAVLRQQTVISVSGCKPLSPKKGHKVRKAHRHRDEKRK